jgi:hypothetical protein
MLFVGVTWISNPEPALSVLRLVQPHPFEVPIHIVFRVLRN